MDGQDHKFLLHGTCIMQKPLRRMSQEILMGIIRSFCLLPCEDGQRTYSVDIFEPVWWISSFLLRDHTRSPSPHLKYLDQFPEIPLDHQGAESERFTVFL